MQTPVRIDFQGAKPVPSVRQKILQQISELEDRFGRITSCRVAFKAPSSRHRTGQYEVNIHLELPNGRHIDITRTPQDDERQTDLDFALHDAFKRARRRLQDGVRRMQGQVKTPQRPPVGTVATLGDDFGFVEAGDGREIYFHRRSVIGNAFPRLKVGTRVTFVEESGVKGPQASTVKLLGKHRLR